MNKWKIFSIFLLLTGLALAGFQIKGKFDDKKEVSSYVAKVNKWNQEQSVLQNRYQEDVYLEPDSKKATDALGILIDDWEKLARKAESIDSDIHSLQLSAQIYKEGLQDMAAGYRYYYHAMKTNEASLLKEGEKSLNKAESTFRTHETHLSGLAHAHFIQLH